MRSIEHLVLLHGWGGDSRCWLPLQDALRGRVGLPVTCLDLPGFGGGQQPWPNDDVLLQQLYRRLPNNCLLVGHSLGGMLAVRLAALPGQHKIHALMTIAANARFVHCDGWPGMDPRTFAGFQQSMRSEPEATCEKFCGLQASGDGAMRAVLRQLKQWRPLSINSSWGRALDCLGRLDNRMPLKNISLPALHLLGENDALVPAAAADRMQQLGVVEVLEGRGHAPHISSPELVAEKIAGLLAAVAACGADQPLTTEPFDKKAVARSFGRAATSYDEAAHLQRVVCRQLLSEVGSDWMPERILDLGSGTGYGSDLLRQRFPQAQIIALDLAEGMLRHARAERPYADFYIAADAEQLPLVNESVDLVFSSMALQWCYQLPQLFAELARVLVPDGHSLIATLGPGTLRELKSSWARVDSGVHVNRFLERGDWLRAANSGGLAGRLYREERVLHFDSVLQLMRELKNIGAHNVNRGAGRGLTGRDKLRRLADAYEPLRTAAGLPASYEIFYLDLQRAQGSMEGKGWGTGIPAGAR